MKYLSLIMLPVLLLTASCEETVQAGKGLTDEERAYLRERAEIKCKADTDAVFESFFEASNDNMLEYTKNKTWKYEYKKDSNVIETSYFYVWKVTAPAVYLRLKLLENGVTTNYFIKVETTENEEMMKNIQRLKCKKTYDVTTGAASMTLKIEEDRVPEDADTESEVTTDYRFSSSYPAYFASLNRKRTKKIFPEDSDTVKTTETYDYILTAIADVTQPLAYNDATIINRKYCVIKNSAPVAPDTFNTYAFPFDFKTTCVDSDTNGPDGNGDAVEDFDPITEL
jgi:hypothetical protein